MILVIVGFSLVGPYLRSVYGMQGLMGSSWGVVVGIINEVEEMLVLVAVPLLLGLVWNRWAGGASGFLLGGFYALWFAVKYGVFSSGVYNSSSMGGFGPTILGYVLSAMLIGYMVGALNKDSENFKRMLISAVIATTIGGVFLFGMFQFSSSNVMVGVDGFLLTVLTRVATGLIIVIVAKVFMWYGMNRNSNKQ